MLFKSLQCLLLSLLEENRRKREHCLHTFIRISSTPSSFSSRGEGWFFFEKNRRKRKNTVSTRVIQISSTSSSFSSREESTKERTLSPHLLFKSLQRLLLSLLEERVGGSGSGRGDESWWKKKLKSLRDEICSSRRRRRKVKEEERGGGKGRKEGELEEDHGTLRAGRSSLVQLENLCWLSLAARPN